MATLSSPAVNAQLEAYMGKKFGFDEVTSTFDPASDARRYIVRYNGKQVSFMVRMNYTTTLSADLQTYFSKAALQLGTPNVRRAQNELDIRFNNVESMGDIFALQARQREHTGYRSDKIIMTPDQVDILMREVSNEHKPRMQTIAGMDIIIEERDR